MITKKVSVTALVVLGIYFLFFHSAPFPLSHDAIGLPPLHGVHTAFGVVLLVIALYLGKKR